VFTGESFHSLDAKHRVFIPKRFQRVLGSEADGATHLVLTHGAEPCLYVFSNTGFDAALERLKTQAFGGGEKLRNLQRRFFSKVHPTQLDTSGRIVLPEGFRDYAGIEKEIAMIGVANRAEIWDRQRWESLIANADLSEMDSILVGDDDFTQRGPETPLSN